MQNRPNPIEPLVATTVFDDQDGVEKYKGIPVDELLKGPIEETVWLLWTGKKPTKIQADLARMIIIMVADHGPAVAGAYSTILATSAGLELPQAVAVGIQMIGPRFGGASGAAAKQFKIAVQVQEEPEKFIERLKAEGINYIPGIGHRVFSKSKPDKRVQNLVDFAKENIVNSHSGEPKATPESPKEKTSRDAGPASRGEQDSMTNTPHLDFALQLEEELLKKNEKLILNIDGTIGAVLLDADFPVEGIDGFFVLARTIGLIAHYIDQKQRGTGLIRLPEGLILHK